jgi:hypothetical protein
MISPCEHRGECEPQRRPRVERERFARCVHDDADAPLRHEAAAEHDQVQRGVRAARELPGKALVQHGEAEHVDDRTESVQRPPRVAAGQAEHDRREHRCIERESSREHVPRMNPAPGERRREEGNRAVTRQHHDAQHEQMVRRACAVEAADLHEIGHRPQALYRHERAHSDARHGRDPPEARMREHPAHAGELCAEASARRGLRHVGHAQPDPHGDGVGRRRQRDEERTPRDEAQRELGWRRCGERAGARGDHHPARQRRVALARIPRRDRLQRRHQARRDAEADQRPGGKKARHVVGDGESERAAAGDEQQHRLDAPRTVAVEHHPGRHLHGAERDEVGARHEAERGRRKRELAHELRRDHRRHRPVEIRQQVRRREREVELTERRRARRAGGGRDGRRRVRCGAGHERFGR